jgi:hypothetical protein
MVQGTRYRVQGFEGSRIQGVKGARVPGNERGRKSVPGDKNSGFRVGSTGYKGSRGQGFKGSREQGFQGMRGGERVFQGTRIVGSG